MHLSKIKEKFSDCLVLPVNPHEEHDHTRTCLKCLIMESQWDILLDE